MQVNSTEAGVQRLEADGHSYVSCDNGTVVKY